jgi:AraC-like DNA-binding protein
MSQRSVTLRFYSDIVIAANDYVERNYDDCDLSLDKFVSESSSSKRSVQRALAYHGMSWRQMIQQRRIEAAKNELLSGNKTVAGVARCVGYRQVSHMTRVFRRTTGDTPAEYRRKHKLAPSSLKAA